MSSRDGKWKEECLKAGCRKQLFKKSLFLALRVPGDYEPALQEKITAYNKGQKQGVQNLLDEREVLTGLN